MCILQCELLTNVSEWTSVLTVITSICALGVTIIVSCAQHRQEKKAQKITLFDKRYNLFEEFSVLYGFSQFALELESNVDKQKTTIENYVVVVDAIVDHFGFLKDKSFVSERFRLDRIAKIGGEEGHLADIELMNLEMYVNQKLIHLKKQSFKMVTASKFCFNKEVSDSMNEFINALFNYIEIYKNGSAMEEYRDISSLKNATLMLEKKEIFKKIEKYLSV